MEPASPDILENEPAPKIEPDLFGESEPKIISVGKIKGETRGRKAGGRNSKTAAVANLSINDKDISQVLEWLFRIPTFYGWGEHWELSKAELKDLTEKTRAVLDQFPDSVFEKYGAATSKFFAPASLIISVATLCYARYAETQFKKQYELFNQPVTETRTGTNGNTEQSKNDNRGFSGESVRTEPGQNSTDDKANALSIFERVE